MKKLINRIFSRVKSIKIDRDRLESIVPYLVPEYWASNKKSFLLFWFIGSFTLIFLIWALIAEVNQVVRATGQVVPDSKVHVVQSGITGPVEEINIKLDDKVSAGDVLFLIDSDNQQKLYNLVKHEYETRLRRVEILRKLVTTHQNLIL